MRRHERLIVAAVVLGLFGLWEAMVRLGRLDAGMAPAPSTVLAALKALLGRPEVLQSLAVTAWEVIAAFLLAVPIGQVRQKFAETITGLPTSNFEQNRTQSSVNLSVQAGLRYTPPRLTYLHFWAGGVYERYWEVGKVGASNADIQDYGGFVGAYLDF